MYEIQNLPENALENAENTSMYAVCTYQKKIWSFTDRWFGKGDVSPRQRENEGDGKIGVWKMLPLV